MWNAARVLLLPAACLALVGLASGWDRQWLVFGGIAAIAVAVYQRYRQHPSTSPLPSPLSRPVRIVFLGCACCMLLGFGLWGRHPIWAGALVMLGASLATVNIFIAAVQLQRRGSREPLA